MRTPLVILWLAGCGGPSPSAGAGGPPDSSGCSDVDGDGRGAGPDCVGPDCDDSDAHVWDDDACEARCESGAVATGCPCDAPEPVTCYGGPAESKGVGVCHDGLRTCEDGFWSPCAGEVLPSEERCDDEDDDCDGEIDEAPCDPEAGCATACEGPDAECAGWSEDRAGDLVEDASGWLTLDRSSNVRHVIWATSASTGQVMRISTETREIEATFWSGPLRGTGGFAGLGSGESPSRTAVSSKGDALVANRTPGGWNSVTKFAADSATCPDVDADGVVETSSGLGDTLAFDGRDLWSDECILWHTVVGDGVDSWARALSVRASFGLDGALEERAWVGLWAEQKFQELDVETGDLTGTEAPTPGFAPYSSAIDREGVVWVGGGRYEGGVSVAGHVGRFDTDDPEDSFEMLPVDGHGKRVIVDENDVAWFGGSRELWYWDRDEEALVRVDLFDGARDRLAEQLGILASDGQGSIWMPVWNQEKVYRVANEGDHEVTSVATPGTPGFGCDADFDGNVWVFGWSHGNATVIDIDDESTDVVLEDCGGPCGDYMYMRGDLAGMHMRNALGEAGSQGGVFEGCADGPTDWTRLDVDALVPEGAEVEVSARSSEQLVDLGAAAWIDLGMPGADGTIDLAAAFDAAGATMGRLLEVRLLLRSGGEGSPTVRRIDVDHCCDEVLQ